MVRTFRTLIPAVMLVLLLAGIGINATHNHRADSDPRNCPICVFHNWGRAVLPDPSPDTRPIHDIILTCGIAATERAPRLFHTLVFASHAPPRSI